MTALFATFLVTLFDPFRAVPAAILGWSVRNMLLLFGGAFAISAATEVMLSAMRITYQFDALRFLVSVFSCGVWSFGLNWLRERREKVKADAP